MTVCIDTNSFVQPFSRRSRFRVIAEALLDGRIEPAVSGAILLEYEEVSAAMYSQEFAREVMGFLDLATTAGAVRRIVPSFHFRIITADPDDDIFADCAIAAAATHIITEDRHFEALRGAGHKAQPITPDEFIRQFLGPLTRPPGDSPGHGTS
jgi:putative PIN family toxin of toxin-antitoxin system